MTLLFNHRSYSSSTDFSDWAGDLTPCVQQLFGSQAFLVTSVGSTLMAWILVPLILRIFHRYSLQSPATTKLDYEKTFWGALEDPVRYLVTFVALSQICVTVAPTSEALQHLREGWTEATILLFTWFLHRWKTNILGHISSSQSFMGQGQQHKLIILNNVSSTAIFGIGVTTVLTQTGCVSVESVVFTSRIGGAAIAVAARDVLADVFSGLSMRFSEPFTIGDTIKAGWVEGEVIEMGMTKTSMVNAKKKEVVVPNSYFCRQVIVIKSRAECRGMISKIPLRIEAIHRIGEISDEIKKMLTTNDNVFLGKGAPYCYLSQIETSHAELTFGYNLKLMGKVDMCFAEQDILEDAVDILKKHAAYLSSSSSDSDSG